MKKKYQPGSSVVCKVENSPARKGILLKGNLPKKYISEEIFKVIAYVEHLDTYLINVPDDYAGWYIGEWCILHQDVNRKFLNKKFFEIYEEQILIKETEIVQERLKNLNKESKKK